MERGSLFGRGLLLHNKAAQYFDGLRAGLQIDQLLWSIHLQNGVSVHRLDHQYQNLIDFPGSRVTTTGFPLESTTNTSHTSFRDLRTTQATRLGDRHQGALAVLLARYAAFEEFLAKRKEETGE
jgi:hypothetical protein